MDLADKNVGRKRLTCENASEESIGKKNGVGDNIPTERENHSGIDNLKNSDELIMAENMEELKTGEKVKVECGDKVVVDTNNSSTVTSVSVEETKTKLEDSSSNSKGASTVPASGEVSVKTENKNNSSKMTSEESMTTTTLEDVSNTEKLPKKDGTAASLAVKPEENESLIVLDDDNNNDLDADLATSEKKSKQAGDKKSSTTEVAAAAKNQKVEQKKDGKDVKTKSPAISDDKKTKEKESLNTAEKKEELNTGEKVELKAKAECGDQVVADTNNSSTVTNDPVEEMEVTSDDVKEDSTVPPADQASENTKNKNNNNLNQKTPEQNLIATTSKVINKCFPFLKTTAKSEENESLIVLVDDIHNDLDADLATSEKKSGKANDKKSTTTSTTEVAAAKNQKDQKTDKKVEQKKDGKDVKPKSSEDDSKAKKAKAKISKACNLWITGLNANTKATDLKALFIKHGKVWAAKVVTTARIPSRRCYGFVTMSTLEEANNCIRHLNQTKFNGTVITVKMIGNEEDTASKRSQQSQSDQSVTVSQKQTRPRADQSLAKNTLGMQIQKKATEPVKKTVTKVTKKDSKPVDSADKSNKVVKKNPPKTEAEKKTAVKGKTPTVSKPKPENKAKPISQDAKVSKDPRSKAKFEASQRRRIELARARSTSQHQHPVISHHPNYRASATGVPSRPIPFDRRRVTERMKILDAKRDSFDTETYRLEKARKELRTEREKLDRAKKKLANVHKASVWPKSDRAHLSSLRYEEERSAKRSFERNHMHGDSFWDHHKQHSMDDNGGSLSLRYDSMFSEPSRYSDIKETYGRRSGPYYSRESKNLDSSDHFDVPVGRVGESSSRLHDRYNASVDSSSRLDMHLYADKFDRMDTGYGRDPDHIVYESDRRNMLHSRDLDHRSVSAHNRLGRMRTSPDLDWKMDDWSGNVASGGGGGSRQSDRWISNTMSANHDHQARGGSSMNSAGFLSRSSGMGGSSSGGGLGSSGLMLNTGPGNSFSYSQMRDSHYDSYTNMDRGNMRRF